MSKGNDTLYLLSDLDELNHAIAPLKEIADRELVSIFGLKGMVYTPHLDVYMAACIERALVLKSLKAQKIIPISVVELMTTALDESYSKVSNNTVVEYKGSHYQRRFLPLKLSKSGKSVKQWAKFWLLQLPNGHFDPDWEAQIREIWPAYFLIRTMQL